MFCAVAAVCADAALPEFSALTWANAVEVNSTEERIKVEANVSARVRKPAKRAKTDLAATQSAQWPQPNVCWRSCCI